MSSGDIWRIVRGRAGLAAAGLLALVAFALLLATHSPGSASAADPADLSVSLSDSPDPVATNAQLTYTIKVHNAGPDAATNTTVTDGLAGTGSVTYVSAATSAGTCTRSGTKVTCDLGTVTTTADATITIRVLVKKTSGQFSNSVSVSSDVTDTKQSNNLDTETTTVTKPPKPPKPATCAGQNVTVLGTSGPDRLVGTSGNDVISAGGGDDAIFGFRGGDLVCAGPGSDAIVGGSGNDLVLGGHGSDRIRGRKGDDRLHGGPGRDRLRGNKGDDLLSGGHGFDRCRGGSGIDRRHSCER
jgi:uncharacterized repeat protein (TIGR01451 family)